jgi:hypothetical protein
MCEVSRTRLLAWVDGELEDSALESHVSGCPECLRETRRIAALSREITGYCIAMTAEHQSRGWWWVPVAAAAIVLLATGLLWMRSSRQTAPPAAAVHLAVDAPPLTVQPVTLTAPAKAKHRVHRPSPPIYAGGPGVLVEVNLEELLPPGAAPPGARLVGNLVFDDTGRIK